MEAWTELVREPPVRDPVATYLPLILSAAGALGVAPFAVMRWMNGDWLIAVIDTVIVAGFIILGTFVYRSRRVRVASVAISLLAVGGTLMTVYARGPEQAMWAFPSLMVSFYLLKAREAILLTGIMVAAIAPRLIMELSTFRASTTLITIVVTTAFAYAFSVINNRQQARLMELATKDPLTGVGNRRALETRLSEIVAKFKRNPDPISLILIDLDHFKVVNDLHGHAKGDQILQRLTRIIDLRIREADSLYRIGGEEFVVVAGGQDLDGASHLAEQLRTLVVANDLAPGSKVTISVGVAELMKEEAYASWLHRADDALYCAKREGRNTVRRAAVG